MDAESTDKLLCQLCGTWRDCHENCPNYPKRFLCENNKCHKRFRRSFDMKIHLYGHWKEEWTSRECVVKNCHRRFSDYGRFRAHLKKYHENRHCRMECKNCQKDCGNTIVGILTHFYWTHVLGKTRPPKRLPRSDDAEAGESPESADSVPPPPEFRLHIGPGQSITVSQFDQLLDRLAASEQTAKASAGPQMQNQK